MCGFVGVLDLRHERAPDPAALRRMTETLVHRGPDSDGYYVNESYGAGFRRLAIIDLESGDQPMCNEDGTLVLVCNGEIFNYRDLRAQLTAKGHRFRTACDVEVLLHLYEDRGARCLDVLNGQFAFAIYDTRTGDLFLARDQFSITPLYYATFDDTLIFASEIKAILEHPLARREVDLTALDQVLTFSGVVSPWTMFKGIRSLPGGHCALARDGRLKVSEYWDLDYPLEADTDATDDAARHIEAVEALLTRSVTYRLQADVPVGFYLSGGLDSSLMAALIARATPGVERHSFSIGFLDRQICESRYQQLAARHVGSVHHQIDFGWSEIASRLPAAIYHCETPLKETFDTCSLALSQHAKRQGISVVLAGDGADEMFAGYVGYRFDQYRAQRAAGDDLAALLDAEVRERVWGDAAVAYETDFSAIREVKEALYSAEVSAALDDFECTRFEIVNKERLRGRHVLHQRSYLDFKLRLSDHLISEHGDRMALAHSVEARYPFLDIDLIEYSRTIPPRLKLNGYVDKYVLRRIAERFVPKEIAGREKWGFHAPGSPYLLGEEIDWVEDLLSYDRVAREGYFNPDTVAALKRRYSQPGFRLNLPYEQDLLAVVLTFGLFRQQFGLSAAA